MRLKDKHTGKIKKVLKIVVEKENGYGEVFTSIKDLNEGYEDVPEDIKPFEEVAKVDYVVKLGYSRVDFVADEECVDTLKVADIDYYEILPDGTKKTEFTWDEAMEIEKKTHGKWRVPTVPEWFAICAAFGRSEDGTDVDPQVLKKNLNLAADEDGYGLYWSAASNSTPNSYSLYFNSSYLLPRVNNNKGRGFAVRCVAPSV